MIIVELRSECSCKQWVQVEQKSHTLSSCFRISLSASVCVSDAEEAGVRQRRASLWSDETKEEDHQTGQIVSSAETSRPTARSLHRQQGRHQTVRLPQLRRGGQSAATTGQHHICLSIMWSSCGRTGEYLWLWIFVCLSLQSPPSSPDEENNPDGVFVFRRKAGCQYLSVSFSSFISSESSWIGICRKYNML